MNARILLLLNWFAVCHCESMQNSSFKVCKKRSINQTPTSIVKARSKIECAVACASDASCRSSNYDKNSKTCELFATGSATESCDDTGTQSTETALLKATGTPQCIHGGTWDDATQSCGTCDKGFAGKYCERYMIDCKEGKENGQNENQNVKYLIQPVNSPQPFQVWCNFFYGMTFIEYRAGSDSFGNFNQNWTAYKQGFGDMDGSYFIGLEHLYLLTKQRAATFKVQVMNFGTGLNQHSYYYNFRIDNESNNYTMHYGSHWSPSGADGFGMGSPTESINHSPFCTPDRDCNSCAQDSSSGWWFNPNCAEVNLNVPSGGGYGDQLGWPKSDVDLTKNIVKVVHFFLS